MRSRMRELFEEIALETVQKDEEGLFRIAEAPAAFPEYAPIFESATCASCGESFMETRGALRGGKTLCLTCAQADCYAVLGSGIRALPRGTW
jgi:formylmethanofuran dehydrogenase subunit E